MLNSERFLQACRRDARMSLVAGPFGIDSAAIKLLNRVLERTRAQLVVSSSWRRQYSLQRLRDALGESGLVGTVADTTPLASALGGRAGEIRAWLDANPVPGFVVLDDLAPAHGLDDCWVQTDGRLGLTAKDCDRAIEICLRANER